MPTLSKLLHAMLMQDLYKIFKPTPFMYNPLQLEHLVQHYKSSKPLFTYPYLPTQPNSSKAFVALVILVASSGNLGCFLEDRGGANTYACTGCITFGCSDFGFGPLTPLLEIIQDLSFIEFFAGEGNVFRVVRKHGYPAAAVDIEYMENPPPNNPMDINSPAGFG